MRRELETTREPKKTLHHNGMVFLAQWDDTKSIDPMQVQCSKAERLEYYYKTKWEREREKTHLMWSFWSHRKPNSTHRHRCQATQPACMWHGWVDSSERDESMIVGWWIFDIMYSCMFGPPPLPSAFHQRGRQQQQRHKKVDEIKMMCSCSSSNSIGPSP